MKDLLQYLISSITGSDQFEIGEEELDGKVTFIVRADKDIIGLIIGKEGKTIKNIRRILAVKAASERKAVNISVLEA